MRKNVPEEPQKTEVEKLEYFISYLKERIPEKIFSLRLCTDEKMVVIYINNVFTKKTVMSYVENFKEYRITIKEKETETIVTIA